MDQDLLEASVLSGGRFIQYQDFGAHYQNRGQGHAPFFSLAQPVGGPVEEPVKAQRVTDLFKPLPVVFSQSFRTGQNFLAHIGFEKLVVGILKAHAHGDRPCRWMEASKCIFP